MVGAPLAHKRIVTVDDVVTSGMTVDESIKLISEEGGFTAAYLVALDRQERGNNGRIRLCRAQLHGLMSIYIQSPRSAISSRVLKIFRQLGIKSE